ncbi:MAG TPA: sigma-70 family RNA polymerase sigma factor [Chthoniobacterales bacterium]|jgi:RNA polymerase sigma factor (TIGR02999 family)|nr:sigma-70 family RNA polymerase sigma factor [Chthoniobacterales bacterium]
MTEVETNLPRMGKKEPSTSSGAAPPNGKKSDRSPRPETEITQVLQRWRNGDASAFDRLTDRVYEQLRLLADQALAKDLGNKSLQPTELVHEAYLRLVDTKQLDWQSRSHFFGVAARLMRQILVDRARSRLAQKRGGRALKVSMQTVEIEVADSGPRPIDLISLDLALRELTDLDLDQGRIVELRFFAGMTVEETAEVLGVSPRTIKRDWRLAKAWLRRRLNGV